ncbi:calmodulin-binding protein [Pelomyxa schiedti]|nr:calmodulin-binding protein [Pelomyxa schiedti]
MSGDGTASEVLCDSPPVVEARATPVAVPTKRPLPNCGSASRKSGLPAAHVDTSRLDPHRFSKKPPSQQQQQQQHQQQRQQQPRCQVESASSTIESGAGTPNSGVKNSNSRAANSKTVNEVVTSTHPKKPQQSSVLPPNQNATHNSQTSSTTSTTQQRPIPPTPTSSRPIPPTPLKTATLCMDIPTLAQIQLKNSPPKTDASTPTQALQNATQTPSPQGENGSISAEQNSSSDSRKEMATTPTEAHPIVKSSSFTHVNFKVNGPLCHRPRLSNVNFGDARSAYHNANVINNPKPKNMSTSAPNHISSTDTPTVSRPRKASNSKQAEQHPQPPVGNSSAQLKSLESPEECVNNPVHDSPTNCTSTASESIPLAPATRSHSRTSGNSSLGTSNKRVSTRLSTLQVQVVCPHISSNSVSMNLPISTRLGLLRKKCSEMFNQSLLDLGYGSTGFMIYIVDTGRETLLHNDDIPLSSAIRQSNRFTYRNPSYIMPLPQPNSTECTEPAPIKEAITPEKEVPLETKESAPECVLHQPSSELPCVQQEVEPEHPISSQDSVKQQDPLELPDSSTPPVLQLQSPILRNESPAQSQENEMFTLEEHSSTSPPPQMPSSPEYPDLIANNQAITSAISKIASDAILAAVAPFSPASSPPVIPPDFPPMASFTTAAAQSSQPTLNNQDHVIGLPVPAFGVISTSPSSPSLRPATGKEKRAHVLRELLTTERTYVRDLTTVVNLVLHPLQQKKILQDATLDKIFRNIEMIHGINEIFLGDMEKQADDLSYLARIFTKMAGMLKTYIPYCSGHEESVEVVIETFKRNKSFASFWAERRKLPECQNLELNAMLIKPVQRLCKYPLLLRELIASTPKEDPEYNQLIAASKVVDGVLNAVNEGKRAVENCKRLYQLQNELGQEFISPTRRFIRECIVTEAEGNFCFEDYHIILFSDLFIRASKVMTGKPKRKTIHDQIPLKQAKLIEPTAASKAAAGGAASVMELIWSHKVDDGTKVEERHLFCMPTEEDKVAWLTDFSQAITKLRSERHGM